MTSAWKCVEHLTFSDPRVHKRLAQLSLMRADVTANNADDLELLKRFRLFGPPGTVLFNSQRNEVDRVVGYESPDRFFGTVDRWERRTGEPSGAGARC